MTVLPRRRPARPGHPDADGDGRHVGDGGGRERATSGGRSARRAMRRWAWRLFRAEWRQQVLILALVVVAIGATVVASAVAVDTPSSAEGTFGTAQDLALYGPHDPHLSSQISHLRHRFGRVDVIEKETLRVPGSSTEYQLRAQDPSGPFGGPMLSLVSGRFPSGAHQVALTTGLAADFGVSLGGTWRGAGAPRTVVGIVEDPESLLTAFALVPAGEVSTPSTVTVLFDAHGVPPGDIGSNVRAASLAGSSGTFNPVTIVLSIATVGLLLIALVAVGGFTVLAQRRLRAIGMVQAVGATDADIRYMVRANGALVGAVGAVLGCALGIAAWLAYRPVAQRDAHHVIGTFALPWVVIGPAMAIAVIATYLAASRPARAVTRVATVAALAGRPEPPRELHRSAVPGLAVLVASAALFSLASANRTVVLLVPAFVSLIASVVLLAPTFLVLLGRVGRRAPVAVRLALRDLARYRARSASALAAISLGVLIAVVIAVIAAGRYGNPLDYAGANLSSDQVVVHVTPTGPGTDAVPVTPGHPAKSAGPGSAATTAPRESSAQLAATTRTIAADLGATTSIKLETTDATLLHDAPGRNFSGTLYVATPALLRAFGIQPSQVDPNADILTMRPGMSSESNMLLMHGGYASETAGPRPNTPGSSTFTCRRATCLAGPVIQEVGALPSGTSAPNTVITEHAVRSLHLHTTLSGWLLESAQPPTATQIADARSLAASSPLYVETKSSAPSSSEVIDWATVFGIALALGILAMSVGLIRSETAKDLRTLAAAGSSSFVRRAITAATAGGLSLLGAVLGTAAGYVACISWFASTTNTGLQSLAYAPVTNLVLIVVAMPLLAVGVGWLLAGREPAAMARQPIE